jgi:hypothetical protein
MNTAGAATSWPDRLFTDGPKRILSIDGGGVRGAVAAAFLQKLEQTLRDRHGRADLVLSDYFDLIGGTSVGAILAAGLALGASATDAVNTFNTMAPRLFGRSSILPRLPLIQARFDPRRLAALLQEQFGDATLGSAAWRTGFGAVSKRIDTGSTWVLTNCPRAKYWNGDPAEIAAGVPDAQMRTTPNRDYPLAKVVQSSAAAPVYFDLVPIEVIRGQPGVFFDGAMTPHGNPTLQMAMVALMPAYGFGWQAGADQLLIVSVGTGAPRPRKPEWVGRKSLSIVKALHALISIAYDTSELGVTALQWLGVSAQPWPINSEIGDGTPPPAGHKPLWTFQRYDSPLEKGWLKNNLGLDYDDKQMSRLERLDDERIISELFEIGTAAAAHQVRAEHFPDPFAPR